jgi:ADP-heptose:LPS heptosyltransferase
MALTEVQQFVLGEIGPRVKYSVANKTNIPKILLIRLRAVDNLLTASPFFDQLRNHFPHSEIILVVGRSSFSAVEHNPHINRLILVDDYFLYQGGWLGRVVEYFRLVCKLRKEEFDLSFVLHRAWPFRLLSCLVGIPVRVGFGKSRKDFFLTHAAFTNQYINESESYLDLLRKMDIPAAFKKTYYHLSDEEKNFQGLFLERHAITGKDKVIAVAPGGVSNARSKMTNGYWPVENYIELINRLQSEGSARIILVGGPDDREITSSIMQDCPACLDTTDLSLGEMASIFRGCSLFIGNDNVRNHIAVAMGIPYIRMFCPTDSRPWFSFTSINDATVASLKPSAPIVGKFSIYSNAEFPTAVSVDEIWQHLTTS